MMKKQWKNLLWVLFIAQTCISCDTGPIEAQLLSYNAETDRYEYRIETITTLDDPSRMEGEATRFIAGTSLTLDYIGQQISWESDGRAVSAGWITHEGVTYPEDYPSMVMLAAYRNFEQSMLFFRSAGMSEDLLPEIETYYEADVTVIEYDYSGNRHEYKEMDNAFYLPISRSDRGFYTLPYDQFQTLPLAVNTGIIAHEYTHAVFDQLVLYPLEDRGIQLEQYSNNMLRSLNEGLADVFAVALTGDPDFMIHSVTRDWLRDASEEIDYSAIWDQQAMSFPESSFDPYMIGEFVSAAIFEVSRQMDSASTGALISEDTRLEIASLSYDTMTTLGLEGVADDSWVTVFFSLLVAHMNAEQAAITCSVLFDRYAIHYEEIAGCP